MAINPLLILLPPLLVLGAALALIGLVALVRLGLRSDAGPWVGLVAILIAAGLLFLAYAIEQPLWGWRRSEPFAWILGVTAGLVAILGLAVLAKPDRAGPHEHGPLMTRRLALVLAAVAVPPACLLMLLLA